MALDHLNLSIARRLALDAMDVAKTALNGKGGLAALPACLAAQVLYEQGCLEEADTMLRERLPSINAGACPGCGSRQLAGPPSKTRRAAP